MTTLIMSSKLCTSVSHYVGFLAEHLSMLKQECLKQALLSFPALFSSFKTHTTPIKITLIITEDILELQKSYLHKKDKSFPSATYFFQTQKHSHLKQSVTNPLI